MKKINLFMSLIAMMMGLSACTGEFAQPPMIMPEGGLGNGDWDNPLTVLQVYEGTTGSDKWVTGYIVGWIDTNIENTYTEQTCKFTTPATVSSNILLAMTPDETDISKCIPVQLPYGDVRTALNLQNNPDNLGMQVTLLGNCEKYFSMPGLKSVSKYNWGDKGIEEEPAPEDPGTEVEPLPTGDQTYAKALTITSGARYLIVYGDEAATQITTNYGYLKTAKVTVDNGKIVTSDTNLSFTIQATEGGYTIQQNDSRYLYMTGDYNSFNLTASPIDGSTWVLQVNEDGTWNISNPVNSKVIQYDTTHGSYGAYPDMRGKMPELYELQK